MSDYITQALTIDVLIALTHTMRAAQRLSDINGGFEEFAAQRIAERMVDVWLERWEAAGQPIETCPHDVETCEHCRKCHQVKQGQWVRKPTNGSKKKKGRK